METTIHQNEESAHILKGGNKSKRELTPPMRTSTGSPAYERVKPAALIGQRVAFSYETKLPMPATRRQSDLLNPDALYGRHENGGGERNVGDELVNNLWSALPDMNDSVGDSSFERPSTVLKELNDKR